MSFFLLRDHLSRWHTCIVEGVEMTYLCDVEGLWVSLVETEHGRQQLVEFVLQLLRAHDVRHLPQRLHDRQPQLKHSETSAPVPPRS